MSGEGWCGERRERSGRAQVPLRRGNLAATIAEKMEDHSDALWHQRTGHLTGSHRMKMTDFVSVMTNPGVCGLPRKPNRGRGVQK